MHPDSQADMLRRLRPYMLSDLERRGLDFHDVLPEPLAAVAEEITPQEAPEVLSFSFQYIDPRPGLDLPNYRVNICLFRLRDETGEVCGMMFLFFWACARA